MRSKDSSRKHLSRGSNRYGNKLNRLEKELFGACGIDCGKCPDYQAHVGNDDELKVKLAKDFSKQFDMDIKPEEVGCLGCHGPLHKPWSGLECFFRQCSEKKDIATCAFCDEFPCGELEIFYKDEDKKGVLRANILKQREVGFEKWQDLIGLEKRP